MMMRQSTCCGLLALADGMALAPPALAQSALAQSVLRQTLLGPPAASSTAPADTDATDGAETSDGQAENPDSADIKDLQLDWSQLNVDGATLAASAASKARKAPQTGSGSEMSWSSNDKANGSAAVSVKQTLSEFLDARVGADMTVAPEP